MKIISFDVGIKNLAYCILDVNQDKKFKIHDWGIIDLVNKPVFLCGCKQKKKPYAICGKSATYMDSEQKYYCKQHAKTCKYLVCPKEMYDTSLKRAKLSELKDFAEQYKIQYDTPILKQSLLQTIMEFKEKHFLKQIIIEKGDTSLVSLSINLMHMLDELLKGIKIDCVLIENQISKIASTMKTIQGMITQYFVMTHVENIHYISSYNKLKMFIESKKNYSYKERKDLGIQCAQKEVIETQENKWLELFQKHKKKDDLADCFLQGLWYINMKLRTT
jgi:hypothetical protein